MTMKAMVTVLDCTLKWSCSPLKFSSVIIVDDSARRVAEIELNSCCKFNLNIFDYIWKRNRKQNTAFCSLLERVLGSKLQCTPFLGDFSNFSCSPLNVTS